MEQGLGRPVPADLRDLLAETDGLRGEWGLDVIWPAARILAGNQQFRTFEDFAELYAPFDGLLFFGDNGGGDQFAYLADAPTEGIFVWEHETDTRRRVAGGGGVSGDRPVRNRSEPVWGVALLPYKR
ncbi:SMI1/KNR4 family protein [Dactylosporangium sp. NPDC000521]|uniref:SMI1/KNR4 family protein n=1 Tax=Dactylosporangium sp. NPDC000521 TaxID=3363975 RepID=UPI0036B3B9A6